MEKRKYQILDGIVYPDDKTEWKGFIDRPSDEVHLPVPDDAVVYWNRRETIPRQIYNMNYTLIQHVSGTDHQLHEYDADIIRTRFEKNEVRKLIFCIRVFVGELFFCDSDFSSIVNYPSEDLSHFEVLEISRNDDCILRIMAIDWFGRKTDLMIIYDSFHIKDNVSNVQKEYIVFHDFIKEISYAYLLAEVMNDGIVTNPNMKVIYKYQEMHQEPEYDIFVLSGITTINKIVFNEYDEDGELYKRTETPGTIVPEVHRSFIHTSIPFEKVERYILDWIVDRVLHKGDE